MYKVVTVENEKQLEVVKSIDNIDEIFILSDTFKDYDKYNNVSLRLSRIGTDSESIKYYLRSKKLKSLMIRNIDQLSYFLKVNKRSDVKIVIDWSLNIYNNSTKEIILDKLKNLDVKFTYPLELNTYELSDINMDELIVYSYVPVMVTNNCVLKTQDKCFDGKSLSSHTTIKDRKNETLHIKTYCKNCYNQIFNPFPIYLLDIMDELNKINYTRIRYDFSFESEKEIKEILLENKKPQDFTRGHIKRGIE